MTNPLNVSEVRPIEDFSLILADKMYNGGWTTANEKRLINRSKVQLKTIDMELNQTMMKGICGNLRQIQDNELFSNL